METQQAVEDEAPPEQEIITLLNVLASMTKAQAEAMVSLQRQNKELLELVKSMSKRLEALEAKCK